MNILSTEWNSEWRQDK